MVPSSIMVAARLQGPVAETNTKFPGQLFMHGEVQGHLVISPIMLLTSPIYCPPDSVTSVIAVPSTVIARSSGRVGVVRLKERVIT